MANRSFSKIIAMATITALSIIFEASANAGVLFSTQNSHSEQDSIDNFFLGQDTNNQKSIAQLQLTQIVPLAVKMDNRSNITGENGNDVTGIGDMGGTGKAKDGNGVSIDASATAGPGFFDLLNSATAKGGTGGKGGEGGPGNDKNNGGEGGTGGTGGRADAKATTIAGAAKADGTGGRGGNGGRGGSNNSAKTVAGTGGTGGEGGPAKAEATIIVSGLATATAKGGTGGDGGPGGRPSGVNSSKPGMGGQGGLGGKATAIAINNGAGASLASATGGLGGDGGSGTNPAPLAADKGGQGGNGGNGGFAIARATTTDGFGATAIAKGGNGGNVGEGGKGGPPGKKAGQGGLARAEAKSDNTTGNTDAVAKAIGGKAGIGNQSVNGGDADAKATATAKAGKATAMATATAGEGSTQGGKPMGKPGSGTARSKAEGIGGKSDSGSKSTNKDMNSVDAEATSPVVGKVGMSSTSTTETRTVIAGKAPDRSQISSLQAGSFVTGNPLRSDVQMATIGNPFVSSRLNRRDSIGLVVLGGCYPTDGSGKSATFSSSATFEINTTQFSPDQSLLIGLLDPIASGPTFDSLMFQVFREGSLVLSQTFTSVTDALIYFDDRVLNFGMITEGVSGLLDLEFRLDVTASDPKASFDTNFIVSTQATNEHQSVPEPSTLFSFLIIPLSAGLILKRRRDHRSEDEI